MEGGHYREASLESNALQSYLARPEVHRLVLAGYRGPYSLGIGTDPQGSTPVLILQVSSATGQKFPSEVPIGGELIPLVVRTGFTVPQPLRSAI